MSSTKIKSFCKVNLSLKVIKKLKNNYHNIKSLITFCELHDLIRINKIQGRKDIISFSGRFKKGIDPKSNTINKALELLRKNRLLKNQKFKISIRKNIPHGSGLGGGSSNAAVLLNYFNSTAKPKLSKKKIFKIASQIGSDVPISLEKKNTFLTGKKGKILRFNKKFKFNLLIVYPNLVCSTREIYKKNRKVGLSKSQYLPFIKNKEKLINLLKHENNDLENVVTKIYPRVKRTIDFIKSQKGCYFSRITGSGSACIGIFSNMKNAIYVKKKVGLKYPKYWCAISKTI